MAGVAKYEDKGAEVIIFGDMNVRTAQENDFLESTDDNDIDDYLPIPDDFELDYTTINKNTLDKTEISGHGKDFLKNFSKSTGFRIINRRFGEDQDLGNFTCHTPAGSSLVDYCLLREKSFHIIENFKVGEINTLSDHSYLQLRLKINLQSQNNTIEDDDQAANSQINEDPNSSSLRKDYDCKYAVNEDYKQKVTNFLNSTETEEEIENLMTNILNVNLTVGDMIVKLRKISINISDKSFKKIRFADDHSKKNKTKFQERFDEDCRKMKRDVNMERKQYQEALRKQHPTNRNRFT